MCCGQQVEPWEPNKIDAQESRLHTWIRLTESHPIYIIMVDPFTITAGMSRRRSLASIAVLFLLTLIYLGVSSIDDSSDILNFKQPSPKLLDVSSWSTQQIPPAVPPPPKITIIAIWNPGNKPSSYLPNFFASVQANPSINLLFIVVDKHNVGRCHEPDRKSVV